MTQQDQEQPLGRIYDRRLAGRLSRYLYPYRWLVVISVVLLASVSALKLVAPILTEIAIDEHIANSDTQGLTRIAQLFLLLLAIQFLLSFVQIYLTNWTGQKIMYDLRMELFSHIQKLHLGFFDKIPVGRLITRVTTDVDVLNELFTSGVVNIIGDLVSLFGILLVMLWLDWRLALITFTVIPFLFLATIIFKFKVRDSYRRVRTAVARINSFLQENITGMSIVQIFVQEERKLDEFKERNNEHLQANLASILYHAIYYPAISLIAAVSIGLIIWYGGLKTMDGTITLGVLVAFIQYSERFYKPISDLAEKFNILQNAMASSERIFDLLDTEPAIQEHSNPESLHDVRGSIEFRNVTFSYRPGIPVIKNVSFRIDPEERVAIVGATGSGKSTLINLLCRFYEVDSGEILIDGINIRKLSTRQLRASVAVVLQDVFLFSGSIEENVKLWDRPISDMDIEWATQQVNAQSFIQDLPEGYSTSVTERGSSLSVGQRQLLAFARALAHSPQILVLDEATSSVDTETEALIQDAVERLMEGHTSLIIAHRLSTIQHCDRVIVLHKGEVIEEGPHEELLEKQGVYQKLHALQFQLSAQKV